MWTKADHERPSLDVSLDERYAVGMRPVDLEPIGEELAIKWNDGTESFVRLDKLRQQCPCATCKGEVDVLGNLYKGPDKPLTPEAVQLRQVIPVGGYAIQPVWADGHSSGLYAFEYLRKLAS